MIRRITRHVAILAIVVGAFLIAVPALAYTDTSPGSGMTVPPTVQPGQGFSATATFTDVVAGTGVTFSASSSGGCTGVVFSPASTTLNTSHQATSTVTIPSSCAGQSVTITATTTGGASVSAAVSVAGGFPNTVAAIPAGLPFGWIVIAFGLLLLAAGTFGLTRRSSSSSAEARA